MDFGENLKLLLKENNMSEADLSKKISRPQKTINDWINGRVPRETDVYKEIAKVFKVSVHRVLYGEDEPDSLINSILEKTEIHTGLYEITVKKVNTKNK